MGNGAKTFRVELADYLGPLELLLHLVRRQELDILHIPIALIASQYVGFLGQAEQPSVDEAGEFLSLASMLMEWKAQHVLPTEGDGELELPVAPSQELVRHLVAYREIHEAARALAERARAWDDRFSRLAVADSPPGETCLARQPIAELQVWDLLSAFGRMLQEHGDAGETQIQYDETPVEVLTGRIRALLVRQGRIPFRRLLERGANKSEVVGYFLAVLELARHGEVRLEQPDLHGEIHLCRGDAIVEESSAPAA